MQRAYRNAHTAAPTGYPQPAYRATSRTIASVSVSVALPPKGYYSESIKRQAIAIRIEGMGYSTISRVLGVKPETITGCMATCM